MYFRAEIDQIFVIDVITQLESTNLQLNSD